MSSSRLPFNLGGASYAGYIVGVNGTISRSTFINAKYVREEAKCFQSNNIKCLRAHWRIRVAAAAETARRSIAGVGSSEVEADPRAYVQWVEQFPPPSGTPR